MIAAGALLTGIVDQRQMKSYQRNRFVAFVAPGTDVQGAAYNVIQSKVAIGSGGSGARACSRARSRSSASCPSATPTSSSPTSARRWASSGASLILGLYMIVLWRIVTAAREARDRYGYLVCAGLASMFAFELMMLNIGMCLGLMPVAGIPLPLISYGGSSLVINLWSLGIVANIYARPLRAALTPENPCPTK